jgi:predicted Zn-dependent protease
MCELQSTERKNMKRWRGYFRLMLVLLAVQGCSVVPHTQRKALVLISPSQEMAMGEEAYREVLSKAKLSKNKKWVLIVDRVGRNIARVSDKPNFDWEFSLVESPHKNAFCLPGGKVAVYTGIMEVAQNEAGLAAIMGHEIAHAVARHGAERMTQLLVLNLGMSLADVSLKNTEHRELILAAIGVGANLGVLLPYSRKHETEADDIGTLYMAKAGYDPYEAIALWERFAEVSQANPPAFFSTHPPSLERAEALRTIAKKAMVEYQRVPNPYGKGESLF